MNKKLLSGMDSGFMRLQLEKHLREKGIDIQDECSTRLYFAAIQGATLVHLEAVRIAIETNDILTPTISDHAKILYSESEKLSRINTTEILMRKICEPVTTSFLKYIVKNYNSKNSVLQILDFLKGMHSTGLKIEYRDDSINTAKVDDPLGCLSYNLKSREIKLSIFVDELIDSIVANIASGKDTIDLESLFVMTLAHELSHLGSAEISSREQAIVNKKILELRGVNIDDIVDMDQFISLLDYRSGYRIFTMENEIEDPYKINEAITELVAKDFYDNIVSSGDFPDLKKEYRIGYTYEVRAFENALHDFTQDNNLNYEEIWEQIKKGYFYGGKELIEAINTIIYPIYPKYRKLIDLYKVKKESNIVLI